MIDEQAIRRLEAMGIPVWQTRTPKRARSDEVRPAVAVSAEAQSIEPSSDIPRAQSARVRLEAGSGRWLLVIDDADRARHATLIEDIRATLGSGDCRFGTWSDSSEAGVGMDDWDAHGIRHALVFGGQAAAGFVEGGELARLNASGEARRALWRQLKPLLGV